MIREEQVRARLIHSIQLVGMSPDREREAAVTAKLLVPVVMKIINEELREAKREGMKVREDIE